MMTRPALFSVAMILASLLAAPRALADDMRPHLIEQMKASCFSQHDNDSAAEKAKCDCYARTFVKSLTPGEIAVPQQSAAITYKLKQARQACHFGDF